MAFFSVIIPVYNKERFLEKTINSVLNQSFTNFELLLINDGSTDNSLALLNQFTDKRIRLISQTNQGVSAARNLGIQEAKSPYLAFLDADDIWEPDHLETMHNYCIQFPDESLFNTAKCIDTGHQQIPAHYAFPKTADFELVNFFEASGIEPVLWTSSVVIKKTALDRVGNFDSTIKSGQDLDLWIRLGMHFQVVFIWQRTARYTFDAQSLSKQTALTPKKMNFSTYAAWEKENPALKRYLDWNRYSLGIKSKLRGDWAYYQEMKKGIAFENLSIKKRVLFALPAWVLHGLVRLQSLLIALGLRRTLFK
ncbi:MAG: glycosyltransferase family A protein [Flavobacterium psychrophilum]